MIDTGDFLETVSLLVRDVHTLREGHSFVLEPNYKISKTLHRSFLQVLKTINFGHTFSFFWPPADTPFFNHLAGLKMVRFV